MKIVKLCQCLAALALVLAALPIVAVSARPEPGGSTESSGVNSLANSFVYGNPLVGGDECFLRNALQEFCFTAVPFTDDWDYVFYLWMRFPDDWIVHNVYVQGNPVCQNGGTFDTFSWSTLQAYEVRIDHTRYHANPSDRCDVDYCFQVTSGAPEAGVDYASVSWYWTSSGYGSPPYYPCSWDGYTPAGQPGCDEWTAPLAGVAKCSALYLPLVLRSF